MRPRIIVHLDADAFFVAVEQATDPKLRGKAVAVGGEKRGIIASASYEARKFGVYTPMPTVQARKLCPKLIVISGDYERYEQFSNWMFSYAYDFTPDVEQTSIDEGYFDLSGAQKSPREIAETIRKAISQRLKISVSEGIGANKLVSSIASKLLKPAAFGEVPPGKEREFLNPLGNKWLPGVGPKTSARLNGAGLARIEHIAATPLEMLELLMGNQAASLRQFAHGIDERPLVPVREPAKSFGQQETFATDLTDEEYIEAKLRRMADNLFAKVREESKSIRTLTVRVRYNDMAEDQVSESLLEPTDLETEIYGRLHGMLRQAWKRRVSLRLVSLKLSNVYDGRFRNELQLNGEKYEARGRLALVIDELRQSRGQSVVLRGHDLLLKNPPRSDFAKPVSAIPIRHAIKKIAPAKMNFVPLRVHSYYSFLDSTLSPTQIVQLAKQHDLPAVAMTDTANLHGAAEFVTAAKAAGIKPIVGAEIRVGENPLLLYVESKGGYQNLCRLLSAHAGKTADENSVVAQQRRSFHSWELNGLTDGLIAVSSDATLAKLFPNHFYRMAAKNAANDFPAVACPAIHHVSASDRLRYDIVQSIRTLTLLRQPHAEKRLAGRYHFRLPDEMRVACKDNPDWMAHSLKIAERCNFEFPFGKPQFPDFHPPDGSTPREFLRRLVKAGLQKRYANRAAQFAPQVDEELNIIAAVGYEDYFLVVWDFLQECRARGIEWITRGSAADSLVCYCLGISGVCPIRFDLYFKRFLNPERMALNKLPDIDIDFAHDKKDEIVEMIFQKYGAEHCAVVGGFSTYQARGAVGDVAKVLGVSEHQIRRITERFPWSFGSTLEEKSKPEFLGASLIARLKEIPECRDLPLDEEPYKTAVEVAAFLDGFPRYPKMHPCGVVLSRQPLHELTPTFIANKGWATTHYDMDAVEVIGLVKMDILVQGGLAVMRDAKQSLVARGVAVDLENLEPWNDPNIWEMIASGGARAVHHIESPAMTSLCRMTNVREIDGLVAIVSVIRPGAANESKKLSFTRRYQGMEPIYYPHPCLESCLKSTFGLVVYEEHILQICEAFAGLSAGRADVLRRGLVKQKAELIAEIGNEFVLASRQRGHGDALIAEVWQLVSGFSGYAFNKAHSTAYGVEAYQAGWLKCYHPTEFMAAVLTHGKGFYHPLVYVLECHRLGIKLLSPSVNDPGPAFTPHGKSIRVALTKLKGISMRTGDAMIEARQRGSFPSMADFFHRVKPSGEELEAMIRVGALDEFGETRTRQFWQAQQLIKTFGTSSRSNQSWLIPPAGLERLPEIPLNAPTRLEKLQWETELFGYAVSGHPLELYGDIAWDSYCPVSRLGEFVGQVVTTCGLIVEQRTHHQITGEPMKFLSISDKTGIIETELFAQTYRSYGLATVRYPVLEIEAKVEAFENGRGFSLRALRAGKPRIALHECHSKKIDTHI
jgi:DNA-directed DNA polymerase III PolC